MEYHCVCQTCLNTAAHSWIPVWRIQLYRWCTASCDGRCRTGSWSDSAHTLVRPCPRCSSPQDTSAHRCCLRDTFTLTNIIIYLSNSAVKAEPTQEETGLVAAQALVRSRSGTTMARPVTLVALTILAHVWGQVAPVEPHTVSTGVPNSVVVTAEAGGGPMSRAGQTRPVTI